MHASTQTHSPRAAQDSGSRRRTWSVRITAVAALLSCSSTALTMPQSGLEGLGAKVDDTALSEMRGKYITPEGVSYFGVAMTSSWQTPDGITTSAVLLFNVDFAAGSGAATPHMYIGWNRDCGGCADPAMDVSGFGAAAKEGYVAAGSDGLSSVQGAAQAINISGSDNMVHNGMSILITPAGETPIQDTAGLTPANGSSSQSFADGDAIHFILEPGQLALALTSGNGTDRIDQSVSSTLNQISQSVVLESSLNTISNFVGLSIGVDPAQQAKQTQFQNAVSAMKGNGF